MSHLPLSTWDPKALWEVHQTISHCAQRTEPSIQILRGNQRLLCSETRWGVFASSFNPPTTAHEAVLQRSLESCGLNACLLLLDVQHADKPTQDALLEDRATMMQIAFSKDPRFALGVCSHGRFLDKIQALDRIGLSWRWWTFLIGLDTFARILEPRFYTDPAKELASLFQRASFVVFSRPVVFPNLQHKLREWIERGASIAWMALPEHIQEISSTRVRQGRAMGRPLCEWIHPGVETFIEDTGLYLPSPPHPPLYEARKRLLEHLFKEGPGPFSERDLRKEALAICRAAS